jgi:hypothetical protein
MGAMAIPLHISSNLSQTFTLLLPSHRRITKISSTLFLMATNARRLGISAVLIAGLFFSSINLAIADDDRSKPKPFSKKMDFKNSFEKFKYEKNVYEEAMKAREEAREKINKTFKATIKRATAQAKFALANATTAEQKMIIMNALKNARIEAVALRDLALAALGTLPSPPMEAKKDEKRRTLAP